MQYLLDTDICSHVIRARDTGLLAVMQDKARSPRRRGQPTAWSDGRPTRPPAGR